MTPTATSAHNVLLDKTEITTLLYLRRDFIADPNRFILRNNLEIRTAKSSSVVCADKVTRIIRLDVLAYKGIHLGIHVKASDPLADVTITFNPGVCLYGHNGRVLSLDEFMDALNLLRAHLTPLLQNPSDWVDLIPGLHSGGVAYWSYLEVFLQRPDPDGSILSGLRHLRHQSIRTPTRRWATGITAGGRRSKLVLCIYGKAEEMVVHGKLDPSDRHHFADILRLEARMKGKKLAVYFGNDRNIELIGGKPRLVRFYPEDLVRGHRTCFSELRSVYSQDTVAVLAPGAKAKLGPMGRLLARAANDPQVSQTLPELMALISLYTGAASDTNTFSKTRKAAEAEISRRSSLSKDSLLDDEAYSSAFSIINSTLESNVTHDIRLFDPDPLIAAAYQPPGYHSKRFTFPAFYRAS